MSAREKARAEWERVFTRDPGNAKARVYLNLLRRGPSPGGESELIPD